MNLMMSTYLLLISNFTPEKIKPQKMLKICITCKKSN